MLSYSPYDNVAARDYPALFVTTGLWDSQVQYYEPVKWAAKLRATKTDTNPGAAAHRHGGRPWRQGRAISGATARLPWNTPSCCGCWAGA